MSSNHLVEKSTRLVEQASESANQAIQSTRQVANEALESVRETGRHLRVKAEHASDNTVSYIKHEPVKSVLIAVATGAVLMALIGVLTRSHKR
jgi:ElaB/YqjD/DUF883 family membrane-anchored ribosome-binding protein